MKKTFALLAATALLLSMALLAGCEKKESHVGKDIKNTLDRAQESVDLINKRQMESLPDENGH